MLVSFGKDLFELLTDQSVVLVHFLDRVAKVVVVNVELFQLLWLWFVLFSNWGHARVYLTFRSRNPLQISRKLLVHLLEVGTRSRETVIWVKRYFFFMKSLLFFRVSIWDRHSLVSCLLWIFSLFATRSHSNFQLFSETALTMICLSSSINTFAAFPSRSSISYSSPISTSSIISSPSSIFWSVSSGLSS